MQKVELWWRSVGKNVITGSGELSCATNSMENDESAPAAHLCHHFTKGDIRNYDDVYAFGKKVDALTIEIESVNIDALERLEAEGLRIFPKPAALRIINNKILQKEFYKSNQIPTAAFAVTNNRAEIRQHEHLFPAVHNTALAVTTVAVCRS